MSRKLKTYKDFKHGTGVGNLDMKVHGISNSEDIEYTQSELVGSGVPDTFVEMELESRAAANAVTSPGYSYIGDREIYAYGRKASQITYSTTSSGEVYPSGTVYIPLMDIPDGQAIYYPPDDEDEYGSKMTNTSAAPFNVSVFNSGELSSVLVDNRITILPAGSTSIYYTDWFLPSSGELDLLYDMYVEDVVDLDFSEDAPYWTSTESPTISGSIPSEYAIAMYFNDDEVYPYGPSAQLKSSSLHVRPVRIFYSPEPYAVGTERDEGIVFHQSGDIYWECGLEDLDDTAWSNVTNWPVESTSTAIGTGQANSDAIMNQAGYDDWFLPSKDELNMIYTELVQSGIGEF